MFYGILILMYFYDNKKHSRPHIHAEYGEYEASIAIDDGAVLSGNLPPSKLRGCIKTFVAWMQADRPESRVFPDFAALHPGYNLFKS
jgi:hypothetical protein